MLVTCYKLIAHHDLYYQKMIHITGVPGSGKSSLGAEILSRHPQVIVKDTDEFNDDEPPFPYPADGIGTRSYWHRKTDWSMKQFLKTVGGDHQLIVFVGILDVTFSGSTSHYDMPAGTILLYLDVPFDVLWQQSKLRGGTRDEKLREAEDTREYYMRHGYTPMSREQILDYISTSLSSCKMC